MSELTCERCGSDFKQKKYFIQHLKKEQECMPIFSERERIEILEGLSKKQSGVPSIHSTRYKRVR